MISLRCIGAGTGLPIPRQDTPFRLTSRLVFSLTERSVSVGNRRPVTYIAVVILLKENNSQCICRRIGTDHVWSVQLLKD